MIEMQASEPYAEKNNAQQNAPLQAFTGEHLVHALESLLFVACEPLREKDLAKLLEVPVTDIQAAITQLQAEYQDRGISLRRVAGAWQFVTPEEYAPLVERLYRPKYQQLSASAMETLAIVAYKQPITRAEVSAIRQVDSDHVMSKLMEKKLICEVGRVSGAGRAILYGTSSEFLSFFGIDSLADLPQLSLPQTGQTEDFAL